MNSNIKERKKEAAAGGGIDEPENVFSRLVLASEKEKTAGGGLTDDELVRDSSQLYAANHLSNLILSVEVSGRCFSLDMVCRIPDPSSHHSTTS
jgi:hypothetical protein